ncbi:hypothetical protein Luke3_00011 [Pseudomonas phage vB_PpuP-Luke-3]
MRKQYQDSIKRNLTGPALFGLLARAGVPQVDHANSHKLERKVVGLNSNLEMKSTLGEGFTVERVEKLEDGSHAAHLVKSTGLNYAS